MHEDVTCLLSAQQASERMSSGTRQPLFQSASRAGRTDPAVWLLQHAVASKGNARVVMATTESRGRARLADSVRAKSGGRTDGQTPGEERCLWDSFILPVSPHSASNWVAALVPRHRQLFLTSLLSPKLAQMVFCARRGSRSLLRAPGPKAFVVRGSKTNRLKPAESEPDRCKKKRPFDFAVN